MKLSKKQICTLLHSQFSELAEKTEWTDNGEFSNKFGFQIQTITSTEIVNQLHTICDLVEELGYIENAAIDN